MDLIEIIYSFIDHHNKRRYGFTEQEGYKDPTGCRTCGRSCDVPATSRRSLADTTIGPRE